MNSAAERSPELVLVCVPRRFFPCAKLLLLDLVPQVGGLAWGRARGVASRGELRGRGFAGARGQLRRRRRLGFSLPGAARSAGSLAGLHLASLRRGEMQPPPKKLARVDTLELKAQIVKRLGQQRAELYFRGLRRFLGGQLGKAEFEKICAAALGKENIRLHNVLIRSILGNACLSYGPPPSKQAPTGNSQTSTVSNGTLNNGLLPARRVVRPLTRRYGDKPSPIGKSPLGHPGAGEFVSAGSKALQEVISVEDGEEVDQARGSPVCVQSQSPIRAPLGIPKAQNSQPSASCSSDVCYSNGELPDSQSLSKLVDDKLKAQGLSMRKECADVLNSGLNLYMGQILKACLGVAKARGNNTRMRQPNGHTAAAVSSGRTNGFPTEAGGPYQASLLDLWTAVQSNDRLLGYDHALQREKIASHLHNT